MANFDVSEKWSPLQLGALMRKIPSNAFRNIFISFLKIIDCKDMYLNGYETNFHLIDHTVFMTDHCNSYSYAYRTSDRQAVIYPISEPMFDLILQNLKMRIMLRCLYER